MWMVLSRRSSSDFHPEEKMALKRKAVPPCKAVADFVSNMTLDTGLTLYPTEGPQHQFLYLSLNELHILVFPS